MKTRLLLAALILITSACAETSSPEPPRPRPKPTQDRTDLVEALRRTQAAPYHFAVDATLPENERLEATGAADATTSTYTSSTDALERIAISTDYYQREPGDSWVHLDLNRAKKDPLDTTDPTGLRQFIDAITSATKTGPTTYAGRFRPDNQNAAEPFLPIGVPSLWSSGMRVSPFTATVDAEGWVTSIVMELSPTDSPTLSMRATLSAHGKPLDVEAPEALEADETLYE